MKTREMIFASPPWWFSLFPILSSLSSLPCPVPVLSVNPFSRRPWSACFNFFRNNMDDRTHLRSLTRDLQSMLKIPDVMTVVEVEDDVLTERRERFRYCLVGRFLTTRHLNTAIAKQSILKAWRCKAPVQTVELETDTILFQFQILLDMKKSNGQRSVVL